MDDLKQESDRESDSSTVTKTSPMIIRLCTKSANMSNENLEVIEKGQIVESCSLKLSEDTDKKLEISSKGLADQKQTCDILKKGRTKLGGKIASKKSLKSIKETTCPYKNKDNDSEKSKSKSVCSPNKPSSSNNCTEGYFSAKPHKAKSNSSSLVKSNKTEAIKDTCKIEDLNLNNYLSKRNVLNDSQDFPKQRKNYCKPNDSETKQSFNRLSHVSNIEGCRQKIKKEKKKRKHSLSSENISDKDLPVSLNAKRTHYESKDPIMSSPVILQSSNLPSFCRSAVDDKMSETILSAKKLQLESNSLKDSTVISAMEDESSCQQSTEKLYKKSTLFPSEEIPLIKSERISTDSLEFCLNENPSQKRKYNQGPKIFLSSEKSNEAFKSGDLYLDTTSATHHGDKSPILSFKDNLESEDDLEINELEKIREALKQQLFEDIDASPEVYHSNDFDEQKYISDKEDKTTCSLEEAQDICLKVKHSFEEQSEDSFDMELPKVNAREISKKKSSLNFEIVSKKRPVNVISQAEEKQCEEIDSTINQPPLVMQSSNLLFNDELDNRHGGGGMETTQIKEEEPVTRKLKLSSDSNIKDLHLETASTSFNGSKINSPKDDFEKQLIQPDDMGSNSTQDPLNSEQNGVMEFDILDEFESDDNEPEESYSDDSDLSMDEIDAMLEEGFQNSKGVNDVSKELGHEEKEKVILKVRGRDHFDVLPEGWIEVTHNSGMPIYLHKQSRVCSVSKPYFLGPGSTRKHEIPVSAIPCLHYQRELEKENSQPSGEENQENFSGTSEELNDSAKTVGNINSISDDVANGSEKGNDISGKISSGPENINASNNIIPSAKLESVKDTKESGSLDYLAVRDYCKKRFEFQTITVKRFRTWSGRRKHQKQLKRKQRPFLPDSTKLITCPLYPSSDKSSTLGNNAKREFIMNPSGKSPVCILHEYVQHTLRVQPKYIFKELESANTPYGAVVIIDGIEYGCGFGSSKKLAKSDAAKSALAILIPKMKMFSPETQNGEEAPDVEFFDQVRVEDPRVCDLSVKAGQPYPYQVLLECLKRNYGMGDTEIEFWMKNLKHQKNEFFMKVGKHQVSVVCKNKRDGKHRASQAVLQRLHPHIKSWGSLLRMYGKGSCKTLKEKKEEEQRITELQSQACVNKPNMSILNKLKEEMLKYRERMISKKPIGKLIPERMEFFSTSNSNLNNVEL